MAKKEELLSLEAQLKKKYGTDIVTLGHDIVQNKRMIIPVGPSVDYLLGGGVPEGTIACFAGSTGCGKTTLALSLCANAQKEEYGSRQIYYLDAEGRLEEKNLMGIKGLDHKSVKVIRSTKEKRLSEEEFLDIAIAIAQSVERSIIILDSPSAMCPSNEITEGVSGSLRSNSPKIMASFCRQIAGIVPAMNNIVISIHHLIQNTGTYGEKLLMDMGTKIQYIASTRLYSKYKPEKWMEDGRQVGQVTKWECRKSPLGAPDMERESHIRFGEGIDSFVEMVNLAIELGVIEQGGAWFRLPFMDDKDLKFQGQEKVESYLRDKPEVIKTINELLKDMK